MKITLTLCPFLVSSIIHEAWSVVIEAPVIGVRGCHTQGFRFFTGMACEVFDARCLCESSGTSELTLQVFTTHKKEWIVSLSVITCRGIGAVRAVLEISRNALYFDVGVAIGGRAADL